MHRNRGRDRMKPLDFLKAFGLGVLTLALNIALLFGLGLIYDLVINPGQTEAFYQTVYPRIGAWSAPIGAIVLMFATAWLFGARRPARNPYGFAAAVFASYAAIDGVLALLGQGAAVLLSPPVLITLGGGVIAILAGAHLSQRRAA
jgi:hypothetical protein